MTTTRPVRERSAAFAILLTSLALTALAAGLSAAESPAVQAQGFDELLRPDPVLAALGSGSSPLSPPDLEALALRASGLPETSIPAYQARLEALLDRLEASVSASGAISAAARAEAALGFLHDNALKSYMSDATTLNLLLDTGSYNCVSSAVLYLIALRRLGIESGGIKTMDHAFSVVHAKGRDIDVETTNRYGFDPGSRKEFSNSFGNVTGYSYVPPGNYAARRKIGERELISLVLSNRIAMAEEVGEFRAALAMASDCAALSLETEAGRAEGRKLLLDCVNNLGASLQARRDYASIEALARSAEATLGKDPRITGLLSIAVYNRLLGLFQGKDWQAAVVEADKALESGGIDRAKYLNLVVYAYGNAAQRIGQGGDWLAAVALAKEGLARTGDEASLRRIADLCLQNYAVAAHNRFAALFNKGDFAAAIDVLVEALARVPGNQSLESDLAAARKAAKR